MEESIQTTATNRAFARELQSMLEQAEGLLRNAGQQIRNEYRNVKESAPHLDQMMRHTSGARRVPVIVEDGRVTVGYGGT